ncbi:MAG: hypothetical protein ABSE62_03980 [Chthoniobacteraceae bacterium]|jgi:autotransporter-associated beta strand protein
MQFRAALLLAAGLLSGLSIAGAIQSSQANDAGGLTLNGRVLALGNSRNGHKNQAPLPSGLITIENGAILRLGDSSKPGAPSYDIPNYIRINRGVLDSTAGNPHFTSRVTIGPGGATFITHSRGQDMSFDADITGAGPLEIDNDSSGTGGIVRLNNDFSLMGTLKVDGPSPGFNGGRIFLGDPDALNQATLVAVAGMRGIDFAPWIKAFSFGGLTGNADIDLKGKILRVGVSNTDLVYSGNLTDSVGGGGLIKSGSGTMTLTGAHSYRANISVHYGTLVVAGVVAGEIKVGDPRIPLTPAVLMGAGSIGNILLATPGAIVQPGPGGHSTGILTARNFSMIPGSNLSIRLGGNVPGPGPGGADSHGYDQIRASGQFSLYGNLEVSLIDGFRPRPGDVFYIMITSGGAPVLGRFSNLVSNEFTVAGHRFRINYAADSAKNDPASATGHDIALIALAGE